MVESMAISRLVCGEGGKKEAEGRKMEGEKWVGGNRPSSQAESPNFSSGGMSVVSSGSPSGLDGARLGKRLTSSSSPGGKRENWKEDEHMRFKQALEKYGRNWKMVEKEVGTRTAKQIRSHAQKYFLRLVREQSADQHNIPPARRWKSRKGNKTTNAVDQQEEDMETMTVSDSNREPTATPLSSPDITMMSPDMRGFVDKSSMSPALGQGMMTPQMSQGMVTPRMISPQISPAMSPDLCGYGSSPYMSPPMRMYYPHSPSPVGWAHEGNNCGPRNMYMCNHGPNGHPSHQHDMMARQPCGYDYPQPPVCHCDYSHGMGQPHQAAAPPVAPQRMDPRIQFEMHRRQHGLQPVPLFTCPYISPQAPAPNAVMPRCNDGQGCTSTHSHHHEPIRRFPDQRTHASAPTPPPVKTPHTTEAAVKTYPPVVPSAPKTPGHQVGEQFSILLTAATQIEKSDDGSHARLCVPP